MLQDIDRLLDTKHDALARWWAERSAAVPVPIYASVDIRHAGYKVAVVDTNLFPGGFNNLCQYCVKRGPDLFRAALERRYGPVRRVLLVPEHHTRNRAYLDNVLILQGMLGQAGYDVRVGLVARGLRDAVYHLPAASGLPVTAYRVERENRHVVAGDFRPDLVLLNNDLTAGVPPVLREIAQPVAPPAALGWHARRKSDHFAIYHRLVAEVSTILGVEPWRVTALTEVERHVDFLSRRGLDRVAATVDRVLQAVAQTYAAHGITDVPFVFIKNNAGTYGMSITTATSGEQVARMNRKERTRMAVGKDRRPVTEVLIQEGVPSRDTLNGCIVEPVLYLVGGEVLGGFLRQHCEASPFENLNVPGMTFTRPCLHGLSDEEVRRRRADGQREDFPRLYDLLARLAALATGYEIAAT